MVISFRPPNILAPPGISIHRTAHLIPQRGRRVASPAGHPRLRTKVCRCRDVPFRRAGQRADLPFRRRTCANQRRAVAAAHGAQIGPIPGRGTLASTRFRPAPLGRTAHRAIGWPIVTEDTAPVASFDCCRSVGVAHNARWSLSRRVAPRCLVGAHATQASTDTARPDPRGRRSAFDSRSGGRRRPSSNR
jgi:hypothetical protein